MHLHIYFRTSSVSLFFIFYHRHVNVWLNLHLHSNVFVLWNLHSTNANFSWLRHIPKNFVCRSPVAVARSSSGSVAICYVLPVLWMTSHLAVVNYMAVSGRLNLKLLLLAVFQYRMSMNALLFVFLLYRHWNHCLHLHQGILFLKMMRNPE